jgi:hypothetical protein
MRPPARVSPLAGNVQSVLSTDDRGQAMNAKAIDKTGSPGATGPAGTPGAPRRPTQSYTRLARLSEAPLPSTLPPPPFARETDVGGIEWWLDAHMHAVSSLLCLEQTLTTRTEQDAPVEDALDALGGVRDALYALYCDAGDPRLAPLVQSSGVLHGYVRAIYAWLRRVLDGLRAQARGAPTFATKRLQQAERTLVAATTTAGDELDAAIASLPIDDASPVDPLRNLRADVAEAFTACAWARATVRRLAR